MKKLFLAISVIAATQVLGQTTQEEFTYVTKGIQNSIANGLDIKKDYWINYEDDFSDLDGFDYTEGSYKFTFAALIRKADSSLAATIVKASSSVSGRTYWLCIPVDNEELMKTYKVELYKWDYPMTYAFTKVLSDEMSKGFKLKAILEQKARNPKTKKLVQQILENF